MWRGSAAWRAWIGLPVLLATIGCGSSGGKLTGTGGTGAGVGAQAGGSSPTTTETFTFRQMVDNKVDILFVLDNGSSSTEWQQKLSNQIPTFIDVLKGAPTPLDLHIALITTDMGAPSDVTSSLGCATQGDDGAFQSAPRGTCTTSPLANGATYFADDGQGTTNFTGSLATDLQCFIPIGHSGCGFEQPLAAAAHALGADNIVAGVPAPPTTNAGFLRPDAYLAVIFLDNQDDCSTPANTTLFSLNGSEQNVANPLGPIAQYRCNQYGHLCQDPAASNPQAFIMPPLTPPADAQGSTTAPTLNLTGCKDNDQGTGLLIPVSQFVTDIRALKTGPDNQILIGAIVSPATPYAVAWVPESGGQNTQPGELWPEVMHSCGAKGGDDVNPESTMFTSDGSAGDPTVRLTQFVTTFQQSVLASLCDASYAASMQAMATKIGQLPSPPCFTGTIQNNAKGEPSCTVTAVVQEASGTSKTESYPSCSDAGDAAPCFSIVPATGGCVGSSVVTMDAATAPSTSVTVSCQICKPGVSASGC